ncbi:MAG: ParA family protein [Thermomicrobiales bacterium]
MTATHHTHQNQPSASSSRPDAHIFVFANQKGGVGKTTTAVNTATMLVARGFRVLLIDIDPQGNTTSSLGVDKSALPGSTYDVLVDEVPISDAVVAHVRPGLDLLATTAILAGAEVELVSAINREGRLARACSAIRFSYDVVLIDSPPSLGLLTVNALTAADAVIVPIQCEFLALEGVTQLITTVDLVKRQLNPSLDVIGILMTMYDGRTRLSTHVVEEVRRHFPDRIFATVIPRSVRLAEAPSYGQSISEYDSSSKGGGAYAAFVDELIIRAGLSDPGNNDRSVVPVASPAKLPT